MTPDLCIHRKVLKSLIWDVCSLWLTLIFYAGRRSVLGVHWKDWCWSWNASTLATSCKELTHWKRPWCWEGLGAGGEGDDRGWDGWMVSPTWWAWVWVNSGVGNGQGGLACCDSWGGRVRHDCATELNWHIFLSQKNLCIYWLVSYLFRTVP